MPEPGLPWTPLSASRERRLWLRAAAALSVLAALALAAGLALEPGWPGAAAVAVLLAAAVVAWREADAGAPGLALRIDAAGAIWLGSCRRPGGDATAAVVDPDTSRPALPLHVSAHLIALRSAGRVDALWPDSLPRDAFRRLAGHARWHVERKDACPPTLPADGPAAR